MKKKFKSGLWKHIINGCPEQWQWDQDHKSTEAVLLPSSSARTVRFHPNWSNGTAGIRIDQVLNYGKFYWELEVPLRIFGTSMMFGVGTSKMRMHADAFVNLVGEDSHGWGLSHKGDLWHNGESRSFTKRFPENRSVTIGLLFDWEAGTLAYYKDREALGIAFTGLNKCTEDLYPVVSSTAARTEMTISMVIRSFRSLQERCRAIINEQCEHTELLVDQLILPKCLSHFLKDGLYYEYVR